MNPREGEGRERERERVEIFLGVRGSLYRGVREREKERHVDCKYWMGL